jgi:FkbM family methyltransferase
MIFYSQQNEDKLLYEKYLNYKNGFFIEVGAMNGISYSNTKFFEDELNWTGILIEPTNQFDQLIQNRPKCHNYNFAISKTDGEISFIGVGALSGAIDSMASSYIDIWKINSKNSYKVKSIPLHKITNELFIEKIDLLSIDVEGGELEVLNTIDWEIPIFIILIELDGHNKEKDEECRKILIINGFEFDTRIGLNDIWINRDFL